MTPWHLTIERNNIEALKLLIKRGRYRASPTPDILTPPRSPLAMAARRTSLDLMSLLISAGCGLRDLDTGGLTPLHHATQAYSLESIRFLVENGSDVSSLTEDGSSPLRYAVAARSSKKVGVVAYLISKGSDPFLARRDGLTSIDIVIEGGSGDLSLNVIGKVLQTLIDWKPPDRPVDVDLSQPLLRLCQLELVSQSLWLSTALKILLDNGADLLRTNEAGKTTFGVLLCAWQHQFFRLSYEEVQNFRSAVNKPTMIIRTALDYIPAEVLVDLGCDLSSPLLSAMISGDEDLARRLLESSPNVDCTSFFDDQEWSPIGAACAWPCSDDLFNSLLDRSKALLDQTHATKLFASVSGANRMDLAEILLKAGLNPNSRSIRGETPVMQSAESGHAQMVAWLIEHGGDVKAVDQNGWNAAHHACRSGSLEVMRLLRTTDIAWRSKVPAAFKGVASNDVSLLHLAAFHANGTFLKYLIDEDLAQDLNCTTSDGLTPLYLAVWADRFDSVALLLSKNVMTSIMSFGASPLHCVIRYGKLKMYSLFRSHGCDLAMPDQNGFDCEMLALRYGHHELAEGIASDIGKKHSSLPKATIAFSQKAYSVTNCMDDKAQGQNPASFSKDPHAKKPLRMLKLAIERGDLSLCKRALAIGVNYEAYLPDSDGYTPLSYCVKMEEPEIAKFLVLKGASNMDVARKPFRGQGFSLFHYAADCNNFGLLETLLEKQSSQLLQNVAPVHPIHIAILASATDCVELMLHHRYREFPPDSGSVLYTRAPARRVNLLPRYHAPALLEKTPAAYLANVPIGEILDHGWETYRAGRYSLSNLSSYTPLHLATHVGNYACARILLGEGSLINAVTSTYWTALHIAADKGDDDMTELLLASGAQAYGQTKDGRTPPMVAAAAGQLGVLRPFLKSGIDLTVRDCTQQTILHLAARSSRTEVLMHIMTTTKDYDLESECALGYTVLILACRASRDGIGSLMNLVPSPRAYTPRKLNVLTAAIQNKFMTIQNVKMLLKRIPSELFTLILNHRAHAGGTPLYAACTQTDARRETDIINLLLDAGAHLNQDGGPYGTALIAACTIGRLLAVKLLISRGARTTFMKDGSTINVLNAAKRFPEIIHWLLIGRFTEGPRRLTRESV